MHPLPKNPREYAAKSNSLLNQSICRVTDYHLHVLGYRFWHHNYATRFCYLHVWTVQRINCAWSTTENYANGNQLPDNHALSSYSRTASEFETWPWQLQNEDTFCEGHYKLPLASPPARRCTVFQLASILNIFAGLRNNCTHKRELDDLRAAA